RRALRFAPEERRDVGALLRIAEAEAHLLAWDQRLRVGEPALNERLGPHQGGAAQRVRVFEAARGANPAADHAAMRRADAIGVERVAAGAAVLVDLGAAFGVAGQRRRRRCGGWRALVA